MITGHKDADTYLLKSMDDRTLMKTLLSLENTEILAKGEDIFKERLRNNYPYLYEKKPFLETYRNYYLKMMYYIGKLKEEFNIDYVPVLSFNPEGVYRGFKLRKEEEAEYFSNYDIIHFMAPYYAELGDEKKIKEMFENYLGEGERELKITFLFELVAHGNIPLYEKLSKEWDMGNNIPTAGLFMSAVRSGNKEIIDLFNKIPMDEEEESEGGRKHFALLGAAASGNIKILEYIDKLFPDQLGTNRYYIGIILAAAQNGNLEFIRNFLEDKKYKFLIDYIPLIILQGKSSPIANFLPEDKEKQILGYLLDFYFANGGNENTFFKTIVNGHIYGKVLKDNFYKKGDQKINDFIKLKFKENK